MSREAQASSVPRGCTSGESANEVYEEEEEEKEEEERREGRKAELEMRAMGTLHIGRIGMRGRAEEEGRRVFKVHWADGGRGGERGKTTSDKGAGEEKRGPD